MIMKSRQDGFNLIELAVVTVVVFLTASVILSLVSNRLAACNLSPARSKGRDIYVSIVGANTERKALGLPPVWPADADPDSVVPDEAEGCFDFKNSTDYFRYLYDEERVGTAEWSPWVAGFDYTKLAGAGVPACAARLLTPSCNMWTIAKNVREDMPDIIPVLVTRNIDPSSLFAKVGESDFEKRLRPDPEWKTPFGSYACAMVLKGGSVSLFRDKYMSCGVVYQKETFDANVADKKTPAIFPLKYLTPTREVVPGEVRVTPSVGQRALAEQVRERVGHEISGARKVVAHVLVGWGVVYLLCVAALQEWRFRKRKEFRLGAKGKALALFHYLSVVVLFFALLQRGRDVAMPWSWTFLTLAAVMVLAGLLGAWFVCRQDQQARKRGLMWMMAVPLVASAPVVLLFVVFLAFLFLAGCLMRLRG